MRVLHVIDGLGGSGGAERRFVEELLAWPEPDEHAVLRLFAYDDLSPRLEAAGIPVEGLGHDARHGSWSWPLAARSIGARIGEFRPDVVHTSLFHADLAGQLAARRAGVPVVSSLVNAPVGARPVKVELLDRLRYAVARRTEARWRAVTSAAADVAIDRGGIAGAITVVPRGIHVPATPSPADPARFGLPVDAPLIVNVGRQARTKDQATLVRAVDRLVAERPGLHLVVAGRTGDASAALSAAVAASRLGNRYHDVGFRTDADVLLAGAAVVARPSLEEGFATGVLEAVVAGAPVVASDIRPHREVAGPHELAVFVPPGDPTALSDAIAGLLADPPTPGELVRRRDLVRACYSTEAAAAGLRGLLLAACG